MKIDYLNHLTIILYACFTLILCDVFFYPLSIYIYLGTIYSYLLFLLISYSVLGQQRFFYKYIPKKIKITKQEKISFLIIIFLSYSASFELVYLFSQKFGFISIFYDSSLLQSNAISNSLGYLLYLNVLILPYSLFRIFYIKSSYMNKIFYILVFALSLFFFFFTGIKGYLFLAILNLIILFLYFSSLQRSLIIILFFILILISYFIFYDSMIDLVTSNIEGSLNRFFAYLVGSWAVADIKIQDNWVTPYYALKTVPFFYKLMGYGHEYQESFNVFYNINGLNLNVVPFFQYAFIEGGLFLQSIIVIATSLLISITKKFLLKKFSIYLLFIYLFIIGNFILSLTFANTIGGLKFYTTLFILLIVKFSIKLIYTNHIKVENNG